MLHLFRLVCPLKFRETNELSVYINFGLNSTTVSAFQGRWFTGSKSVVFPLLCPDNNGQYHRQLFNHLGISIIAY